MHPDGLILKFDKNASSDQAGKDMDVVAGEKAVMSLKEFEQLFHKNQQFLCMIAEKIVRDDVVAEDLVQDFFIKFWESKDRLRYKFFEGFAYRSVKNASIDYLRRQQTAEKQLASMAELENLALADEEIPAQDARIKRILELLDALPAERRRIFELHVLDNRSYKEIADELGISVNTVKTQLRRAYLTLREKAILVLILSSLTKFL
ncbi:RNA polymerase sigma-70 factor, ECF subfamily [Mucilaginibacter pineti]|uniref:RNA polymerase sigma-70 factor, ECF subfamily n=1 Tax=Mucilaginibacter pineti TaxID=1391627 RepID=A0A1G7ESV2_9SPHI|nr:RNA polymerase sigma-70 factor [Mucilaginibacter pineti]SDE66722.1 RNA polymerase sigma-70 factor, ECF subfamily [Mucilaginibacter pineti]